VHSTDPEAKVEGAVEAELEPGEPQTSTSENKGKRKVEPSPEGEPGPSTIKKSGVKSQGKRKRGNNRNCGLRHLAGLDTASTTNARDVGTSFGSRSPKQQKVYVGEDLTAAEIERLGEVTLLPSRDVPPPAEVPKRGFLSAFSGMFTLGRKADVELNGFGVGDVMVVLHSQVSPKPQYVRCARSSLQRAATSQRWKALIGQGRTIHIPSEEDSFGMMFLLRSAHELNLDKLPKVLTFEQIVTIASIIHRYDASEIVRRDLVQRIPGPWRNNDDIFVRTPHREQWLFVAWVLGLCECFQAMLVSLIRELGVD
jgi:hypothetical protein